ncbi:MAG: ribulose-phosphate 3-epimerase [Muribaculaceae bacterium]|nr:ribulose-phosphate 3-epimerase [Muribaculaceae bacterium]
MKVAPSILSADFGRLGADIEMLNESEAAMIHCDVMDGVFVPNISFGFPVLEKVGRMARKPLDVHLMIVDPQRYVSRTRDCGATIMNIHQEACTHLERTVQEIKAAGMKAAVTLNPSTPVCMLEDIITELDMVLLMSVNPGFGGQKFIENTYAKIGRLRSLISESGSKAMIQVDGGVTTGNIGKIAAAGVDMVVAGSAVFGADDPRAAISELTNVQV